MPVRSIVFLEDLISCMKYPKDTFRAASGLSPELTIVPYFHVPWARNEWTLHSILPSTTALMKVQGP
jgi:hypothetical protein